MQRLEAMSGSGGDSWADERIGLRGSRLHDYRAGQESKGSLDMSAAFEKALVLTLPWALRVYDRFHISKLLGEAVDIVTRARQFFNIWYRLAVRSKLAPIVKVAKTLKTHLEGLLNLLNYFRHRITNAMSAGINSAVQKIKATARSFRNFDNFRTRILFFFGQLDLHPTTR